MSTTPAPVHSPIRHLLRNIFYKPKDQVKLARDLSVVELESSPGAVGGVSVPVERDEEPEGRLVGGATRMRHF